MTLGYPTYKATSGMVLGEEVKGQGHRVTKCKNITEGDRVEWKASSLKINKKYFELVAEIVSGQRWAPYILPILN